MAINANNNGCIHRACQACNWDVVNTNVTSFRPLNLSFWAEWNASFFGWPMSYLMCLYPVLQPTITVVLRLYCTGNWRCHVIYVYKQAVQISIMCLVQKLNILLLGTNYSQWWSVHLLKCLDLSVSILLCADIFLYFTCLLGFKTTSPFPVFRHVEVQQTLKQTNG